VLSRDPRVPRDESYISRVSRSPKYVLLRQPAIFNAAHFIDRSFSKCTYTCVCVYVYACVLVTSGSVSQPDIVVTNPVMDVH